jgi:hypothetical protein
MMKGLGMVGEVDEAWVLMERWERRMRRRVERSSRFYAISRPPQPPPLDLLASLMNAFAEQVGVCGEHLVLPIQPSGIGCFLDTHSLPGEI